MLTEKEELAETELKHDQLKNTISADSPSEDEEGKYTVGVLGTYVISTPCHSSRGCLVDTAVQDLQLLKTT